MKERNLGRALTILLVIKLVPRFELNVFTEIFCKKKFPKLFGKPIQFHK